jgi:DNA-binding protein Fis
MLNLEVRKKAGGAEVHRVTSSAVTIGASSGNEVVVRARGVAGRHVRIVQKDDGRLQLDLFKGVEPVSLNGREFYGGAVGPGDRIVIGEATITVVGAPSPARRSTEIPIQDGASSATALAPAASTPTEIEYRSLRLAAYRLCRESAIGESLATLFVDFLDREFPPTEWAVGEVTGEHGFRPLASTFFEQPALPPQLIERVRAGEQIVRSDTVAGLLTLVAEPLEVGSAFGILVREDPRLPARAVLFLEEVAQIAGLAARGGSIVSDRTAPVAVAVPVRESDANEIEAILRHTDDLKKIVETVEREVIHRAMRRVEGNQSRGAEVLNISRGSLIAKLKEYQVPDYRYLRRERQKRS